MCRPRSARPDFRTPWPWDFDPLSVALSAAQGSCDEGEQVLEERLVAYPGDGRENWPVLRLTLLDPWQERPGIWSEQTPE